MSPGGVRLQYLYLWSFLHWSWGLSCTEHTCHGLCSCGPLEHMNIIRDKGVAAVIHCGGQASMLKLKVSHSAVVSAMKRATPDQYATSTTVISTWVMVKRAPWLCRPNGVQDGSQYSGLILEMGLRWSCAYRHRTWQSNNRMIFAEHGLHETIVTDNATCFIN